MIVLQCTFVCYIVAVLSGDRRNTAGGDSKSYEPESTYNDDMPVERLLEAEMAVEPNNVQYVDSRVSSGLHLGWVLFRCTALVVGQLGLRLHRALSCILIKLTRVKVLPSLLLWLAKSF